MTIWTRWKWHISLSSSRKANEIAEQVSPTPKLARTRVESNPALVCAIQFSEAEMSDRFGTMALLHKEIANMANQEKRHCRIGKVTVKATADNKCDVESDPYRYLSGM